MPTKAYPLEEGSGSASGPNSSAALTRLIAIGICIFVGLFIAWMSVDFHTVHGNQLGVMETWGGGVRTNVLFPKMYILWPGQKIYDYDASSQVFVMNDKPMNEEKGAAGREKDAYLVQSADSQDMRISMNLRWRLDPAKLISIHTTVRKDFEEKLIRPVLMRVVKDEATRLKAIEAYAGTNLVQLQTDIQNELAGQGEGKELAQRGIIVENFVIEHIGLDTNYVSEIVRRQIATQKQQRIDAETKAADQEALLAKAMAQADLNKRVVEAQRDKEVMVLQAQAENQKAVLAAEADKQKQQLEGEGLRARQLAEADGILAMGKAKAKSQKMQLQAYAVPGADAFVRTQIAASLAEGTKNISGYIPQGMNVNVISDNFMSAVESILGKPRAAQAQ